MDDDGVDNLESTPAQRAITNALRVSSLTDDSLALYGRWWQLETWLRELVYLELRAALGKTWREVLPESTWRQDADAQYFHMVGPDNENPLAYLEYSKLTEVIEQNWKHFEVTLLEQKSWAGRQSELRQIRNRIGHVRRSHLDDLNRIEQTLRDLERGAFIAISEYNKRQSPQDIDLDGPVGRGWYVGEHPDAQRLITHASAQYNVGFHLKQSFRPWADTASHERTGMLWHAEFVVLGSSIDVERLMREIDGTELSELVLAIDFIGPWHASFTFSAADNAEAVADAIGIAFEGVIQSSRLGPSHEEWYRDASRYRALNDHLHIQSIWTVLDLDTFPISVFDAGTNTSVRPRWTRPM